MKPYKSLLKNSFLFAVGTLGSRTIMFLMLPVFTRYMTVGEYGQIDLLQTTISFLMPLVSLQIVEAVLRYAVEMRGKKEASAVLNNGLLFCFFGIVITLFFHPLITRFEPFSTYYMYFYISLLFTMLQSIIKQFVRGMEKIKTYVASDLSFTISFVIFNFIFLVYLRLGMKGYLLSLIYAYVVSLIVLVVFGEVLRHIRHVFFDKELLKDMVIYSLPLIPNALMWWVMNVSDRYILIYFLGFEATGLYSVSYKFPSLIILMNSIFFMAWQLSAIQEYGKEGYGDFYRNTFGALSTLLIILTSVILLILKPLVGVFVAKAFFESWKYVPLLLVGAIFQSFSSFFGTNYTASKKTRGAFTTSVVGAVINLILNIIFVPLWGIQAASFATMSAYMAMWLMRVRDSKKLVGIDIKWKELILSLSILSLQILTLYFIKNVAIFLLTQVILILSLVFVQRKYLIQIYGFANRLLAQRRAKQIG